MVESNLSLNFCRKCGNKENQEQNNCTICGSPTIKLDSKAEIYVPLNSSEVMSVIPPGDTILYSTFCKGSEGGVIGKTEYWLSHVLLTSQGVAYTKPYYGGKVENIFTPWNKVGLVSSLTKGIRIKGTWLNITRNPNYESKENYKVRKKLFAEKFNPLMLMRKEEFKLNKKEAKLKRKQEKMELKEQKRLIKQKKKEEKLAEKQKTI